MSDVPSVEPSSTTMKQHAPSWCRWCATHSRRMSASSLTIASTPRLLPDDASAAAHDAAHGSGGCATACSSSAGAERQPRDSKPATQANEEQFVASVLIRCSRFFAHTDARCVWGELLF